jgi:hypothetical protein
MIAAAGFPTACESRPAGPADATQEAWYGRTVKQVAAINREAQSDFENGKLDQLYGRMLLSNRHWGWARLQFQKNLSRWKHWTPQTADIERRIKEAEAGVAECDRHMD